MSGVEVYKLHLYMECLRKCREEEKLSEGECVEVCIRKVFE